jgi:hypothetical protein
MVLGLSVFALAYGMLKSSGLFTLRSGELIRALHERPPQAALWLIVLASAARLLLPQEGAGRGAARLFRLGVVVMAAGLIVSSYARVEGRIVLTEGQQFSGAPEEFVEGTFFAGPWSALPRFGLIAQNVDVRLSGRGRIADSIALRAVYQGGPAKFEDLVIGSRLPSLRQGVLFRVTGFGYSPRYRIADAAGRPVEEGIVTMALFPPGAEDAIRSWDIPHTFYLQYYPDGVPGQQGGQAGNAAAPAPVFLLRIMRNLDWSYSGSLRLQEPAAVDGMVFTVEEVRRWAEVYLVKDHGMLLFLAGAVLTAAAAGVSALRRRGIPAPASAGGRSTA